MNRNFFFILSFFLVSAAKAESITLVADPWCPYSCESNSDKPGILIEMAREVFSEKGIEVKYMNSNWARALSDARAGKYDGVVGASSEDVTGFVLPSVNQAVSENFFWALKDSLFFYKDLSSLDGKKIGVILGYSYGRKELDELISKRNPSFVIQSGDGALAKLVKMSSVKRLDAFIENPYVFSHLITRKLPQLRSHFKAVSKNISTDTKLYIAFSPFKSGSKKYAEILSKGMEKLRKSGKLKKIYDKYEIYDWK